MAFAGQGGTVGEKRPNVLVLGRTLSRILGGFEMGSYGCFQSSVGFVSVVESDPNF